MFLHFWETFESFIAAWAGVALSSVWDVKENIAQSFEEYGN